MPIFRIVNNFDKCLAKGVECLVFQGFPPLLSPNSSSKLDTLLDILYTTCYDITREVKHIDYREFSHNLDKEIDMKKIMGKLARGLNRFSKNFFARHVILVHVGNNRPEVEVQGVLSIHIGKLAADRRARQINAKRPKGRTMQFIVLELGTLKTPYLFDEWHL